MASGAATGISHTKFWIINRPLTFRLLNLEPNYNLIETEDAFVDVEKRGDISSLKWVQLENLSTQDKVKVQIHYSGLDYNDLGSGWWNSKISKFVMLVLDSSERSIGTEFSGIRTDTAKPVMGLTSGKAIATSIEVKANQLFDLPSNWSLEDGASTIGSLFTVWHGLVEQARLSQGLNSSIKQTSSLYSFCRRKHSDSSRNKPIGFDCNWNLSTFKLSSVGHFYKRVESKLSTRIVFGFVGFRSQWCWIWTQD